MNKWFVWIVFTLIFQSCISQKTSFIEKNFNFAASKTKDLLKVATDVNLYPRTIKKDGTFKQTDMYDWTSGFFGGNLWYLYEYTKDDFWKQKAVNWTESLTPLKTFTKHHDLGFMMYCSFGNAYRLTGKKEYRDILIESAESLCTRFNPATGSIKSWNYRKSLDGKSEWFYPVIIDNMMNLELLFFASKVTGNPKYRDIAITHAETTLKNHFRDDFSTYHVVNYDSKTGAVLNRGAAQGYTDASTWSRGQAWAIYGFTMAFRETGKTEYLNAARRAANFYLNHKDLPQDLIPYWDMNVTDPNFKPVWKNIGNHDLLKKDVSAASIIASALMELNQFDIAESKEYKRAAEKMLKNLFKYYKNDSSKHSFILDHSVGSFPNNEEIDVPLVYADYYFLEALLRYKNLK